MQLCHIPGRKDWAGEKSRIGRKKERGRRRRFSRQHRGCGRLSIQLCCAEGGQLQNGHAGEHGKLCTAEQGSTEIIMEGSGVMQARDREVASGSAVMRRHWPQAPVKGENRVPIHYCRTGTGVMALEEL